jgi:hypothetical protein
MKMTALKIRWQRSLDRMGSMCGCCGITEGEIEKAAGALRESLSPFGIDVIVEKELLDLDILIRDPSQLRP